MVFQFGIEPTSLLLACSLFVSSLSIVNHINQSFELWDIPAFKTSIYHKVKIYYIIRLVIIKNALVREFNDTLV